MKIMGCGWLHRLVTSVPLPEGSWASFSALCLPSGSSEVLSKEHVFILGGAGVGSRELYMFGGLSA